MSSEQELLNKVAFSSTRKTKEVLDFVEFLGLKNSANKIPFGERLQQIRTKIVTSGKNLLDEDEIEKELASRRGGLQGRED
ncbi:hypothetical protein CK516_39380 [Nostoc sp. 'Peltigera malacea cyanobiont' DB3992]|nr:hypothetical protein CK516_39380 [Nostoc sp. 'Peltigera malacea cyanobiont' DB3992]